MTQIAARFVYAVCYFGIAVFAVTAVTYAQSNPKRIALKSGESTELRNYFFVTNCRSIMIGQPELEVLEGPEEVTVTLKEGTVLPRAQNCAKPVPGVSVLATAKDVAEPKQAKLTFRLKFNTKTGERQDSSTYIVLLFPGATHAGDPPHTSLPANSLESTAPTSSH
jgi:hypothetical protein